VRSSVLLAIVIATLAAARILAQAPAGAEVEDPWAPFSFLVGSWASPVSGKPGEGMAGSTTFSYDLDKHVLVRRSRAEFAPAPGETAGLVHDDLLIVYREPGGSGFRAIYFDNEGHTINYVVSFPAVQPAVIFDSDGGADAPRFRLAYEAGKDGALSIEFLVAPPGGELKTYVKGVVLRKP
jgi:hypothetical protein